MMDEEIIGLIFNKDEKGIDELKKKYNDIILKMIKSILTNEDDINKCLDLTYKKIQNILPSNMPKYLTAFVLRYARETAIDIYKEKNDKQLNEIDLDIETNHRLDNNQLVETIITDLNEFFGKIGQKDKIIFIRRYFLNEDIKTIANILNVKEEKVDERLKKLNKYFLNFLKFSGLELKPNKQININQLLGRIDETILDKIISIDSNSKYEELLKRNKSKNKKDMLKTVKKLVTDRFW